MLSSKQRDKPDKLAYSIQDAAWVLGDVSTNHVRNLIKDRALDKIRIGRRVMVTAASIKRLLEAGGTSNSEREAA
jgi:Helix-turn-helix domain